MKNCRFRGGREFWKVAPGCNDGVSSVGVKKTSCPGREKEESIENEVKRGNQMGHAFPGKIPALTYLQRTLSWLTIGTDAV